MESKTENLVKVCEERNYVHCITEGIRQAWNNSGNLMHYIWPALVVCAALSALTGLVTQRLVSEASSWMLIVSLVACLLSILGWLFYVATMDAMLVRWRDLDYEPVVTMKTLRSLIGQRMKRDFNVLILLFLLFVLSYAAGYFLVVFHLPLWALAVGLLVVLLLLVPMDMIVMEIRYSDKPLAQCLAGYIKGWRYYGRILAFDLVGLILMLLVSLVALLPMMVIAMVNLEAAESIAMGDLVSLPNHYWLLTALAFAVCTVLMMIAEFVWSHAQCLLWGSSWRMSKSDFKRWNQSTRCPEHFNTLSFDFQHVVLSISTRCLSTFNTLCLTA
ncbi:MAG: hypothetical protein IJL35_00015 [Bacteroidaceae bacterium]|nr:hypothetical protein [Bacteroidaceae bacterium]